MMKGETETLLKFKGFAGWDWESEFQKAMNAYRPDANGEVVDRIRLGIVREFTDRVGEIIGPEFALKLLVEVDGLSPDGIIGHVDFEDGRQTTLARVLERVSWSRYRIPEARKAGPICQSAFKFDPASASNFDPFGRRVLSVALAPSELVGGNTKSVCLHLADLCHEPSDHLTVHYANQSQFPQ
jgi:hypothetical protein